MKLHPSAQLIRQSIPLDVNNHFYTPYSYKCPLTFFYLQTRLRKFLKLNNYLYPGLQIRCVFVYLHIEVVEKRSTLTETVVKNAFVLGDRHLSYANSFHNNRQIRIDQDYSCISCKFSLSAYFRKHVFPPLPAREASQSVRHP